MNIVNPKDIAHLLKSGSKLIDVREDWEVEKGSIKGSINIPMNELVKNPEQLDKNSKYIFYCKSGIRSENVCESLEDEGFQNISQLNGGYLRYCEVINAKSKK